MFVVLEGTDGVGKTTQANLLCAHLKNRGRTVTYVQDPGHTTLGQILRGLLKDKSLPMLPITQALLFAAARAETSRVISEALDRGEDVVADRWLLSTMVYQGRVMGVPQDFIATLDRVCNSGVRPDFTILLTMSCEEAIARRVAETPTAADRFDSAGMEFQESLRKAYLDFAVVMPNTAVMAVDGRMIEDVHDGIKSICGLSEPCYQ